MRNKKSLYFGRGLAVLLVLVAASFLGFRVHNKIFAASYNDISALPTLPSIPGISGQNPISNYAVKFINNGNDIEFKGNPGGATEYTTKLTFNSGEIQTLTGETKNINFYDFYNPDDILAPGDTGYEKLFNAKGNMPYVPYGTIASELAACDQNGYGHVYVISFNITPQEGVETNAKVLQFIKVNGLEAAFSAGIIETTKASPYNIIACSGNRNDPFSGFGGVALLTGYRIQISNAGTGDSGSGSGSGNRDKWYDYAGKQVVQDALPGRFIFGAPDRIIDTGTTLSDGKFLTYHLAEGGPSPYPDNSDEFWRDGLAMYVPTKDGKSIEKSQGKCLGFFMVDTDGRDDGLIYGNVYQIPAYTSGSSCYYADSRPVINIFGFYEGKEAIDIIGADKQINLNVTSKILTRNGHNWSSARRMWYATLHWENSGQIVSYAKPGDASFWLEPVTESEKTEIFKTMDYRGNRTTTKLFTTNECRSKQKNAFSFILIDYENIKTLKETDVYSKNGWANTYVGKDDNGQVTYENKWDGGDLKCLIGTDVQYNWVGQGTKPAYTFVAGIARSVDNKDGSYIEDTPPPQNGALDTDAGDGATCTSSGASLSWIMCPIINGIVDGADIAFNNIIVPLLVTKPLEAGPALDTWKGFRDIANILLIAFLLIAIYAQATGGGLVDAYTAKKIMPGLAVAAIGINLSFYLVALAVDATNILGAGIVDLIVSRFPDGGNYSVSSGLGITALLATGAGIWVAAAGFGILFMAFFQFFLVFILIPTALAFIGVIVTLALRQALIVFLALSAPIALALYLLPNTKKYTKSWGSLLAKTLLVYPIVMIIFAMTHILPNILELSGAANVGFIVDIIKIFALVLPIFLVPFAFKMAGGAIGNLYATLSGWNKKAHQGILGNPNDPNSLRNRTRYKVGDRTTQVRERRVAASREPGAGFRQRALGRALNYGNLQAKRAGYNKQRSEMLQSQIGTGDDSNIRDMFIAWDQTANGGKGAWFRRMDMENGRGIAGAEAVYKDYASGKAGHAKAMSLYKGDKSAVQDGLYYEWKKTGFAAAQMGRVEKQYGEILGEHGFTDKEGTEMMKGVGFRHQQQSLYSKYTSYKGAAKGFSTDIIGMAKEGAHNIGTYQHSNLDVRTYQEYEKGYQKITETLASGQFDPSGIVKTGDLQGRSRQQLEDAQRQLEAIAINVNPNQRQAGANVQVGEQTDGSPQMAGFGVSSAPVEVQAAATQFHGTVAAAIARRNGNSGGSSGTPNGGGSGGSGLILPGSPDFHT